MIASYVVIVSGSQCYNCTASCCSGGQCPFKDRQATAAAAAIARAATNDIRVIATTPTRYSRDPLPYDVLQEIKDERLERWLRSRDWSPAPRTLKPRGQAFSRAPEYRLRIAPPFWTGKNFQKLNRGNTKWLLANLVKSTEKRTRKDRTKK